MARRSLLNVLAGLSIAFVVSGPAGAASRERWSILSNGETVGQVTAVAGANKVDIDYAVQNNGRGPKHQEHVTLGDKGVPIEWTIDGTSLMGGAVHERAAWQNGVESWTSQADHGELRTAEPRLYIANDASPWAFGLYARLLLKAPSHSLDVLPKGTLRLEPARQLTVGEGARAVRVEAYFLTGIDLQPELVLLDPNRLMFGDLSGDLGGLTVRAGYEDYYGRLLAIGQALGMDRMRALQARVAHRYDVPLRIENVHVFDPKSLTVSGAESVVVFRGKITTIETESPGARHDDEVTVDGEGGYLVPGLHDFHSHNDLWSGPLNIAAGVTTVRDMGNVNDRLLDLMAHTDAGDVPGPHIIPSGFIEGRSPYSARLGFVPDTLAQALGAVRWYGDHGYIQIKIYNSMTPEWVKPLADEARRLGMRTVGHIPAFTTPDRMIESGYNEVTHINQLMLGWLLAPGEDTRTPLRLTAMARAAELDLSSPRVQHTIDLMKDHQVGLDTTTSIVEQLMMSRAGEIPANSAAYLDHMPIGFLRYHKRSYVNFRDKAEQEIYAKAFAKVMDVMRLLRREGIPMWPGTDFAIGFPLHRELELYVEAGFTPAEALAIDTLRADAYLRRDQAYGSIDRGKHADFFLVPGDPTRDIGALHAIRMVMKDGIVYFPNEIYAAYGIGPFAQPPPITPASTKGNTGVLPSGAPRAG